MSVIPLFSYGNAFLPFTVPKEVVDISFNSGAETVSLNQYGWTGMTFNER